MLGIGQNLWRQQGKVPPSISPTPTATPLFEFDFNDAGTLFADTSATLPISDRTPVARVNSKAGSAFAYQADPTLQPIYSASDQGLLFDRSNDHLLLDTGGTSRAHMLQTTDQVLIDAIVQTDASNWDFTSSGRRMIPGALRAITAYEAETDPQVIAAARQSLLATCPNTPTGSYSFAFRQVNDLISMDLSAWECSGITELRNFVRECQNLESLNISGWNLTSARSLSRFAQNCGKLNDLNVANMNVSNIESFYLFIVNCVNLARLDLTGWNLSSAVTFERFALNCTSLETLTWSGTSPFANCFATNYTQAFVNTNLSQTSIDALLIEINTSGTANGVFDQSGGAAPSAAGQAAIDAMRARGWSISVTGGY